MWLVSITSTRFTASFQKDMLSVLKFSFGSVEHDIDPIQKVQPFKRNIDSILVKIFAPNSNDQPTTSKSENSER